MNLYERIIVRLNKHRANIHKSGCTPEEVHILLTYTTL